MVNCSEITHFETWSWSWSWTWKA